MEGEYLEKEWYNYFKKKYNIGDDEMSEYIESFELINDGQPITAEILSNFINDETLDHDKWSTKEAISVIAKINIIINKKRRDSINLLTYLLFVIPLCNGRKINKIKVSELFHSLDSDGDGQLTYDELVTAIYKINKNLSPKDIDKYKKEIKKLCDSVDENQDGTINIDEFKKFLENKNLFAKKSN